MYNIIHGNCPRYLMDSVETVEHGANTRGSVNEVLIVPRTNLVTGQRSFKYRAATLWNQMDTRVKQAKNVDTFSFCLVY